ncbi:MAG: hypothetical protein GTN80_07770 [Nitrososphaeria archaeon]|nr:hypothetical protein [Nitrososphaeria archaeon]NIN52962.1 hypothetical protein [Nitrososphaeria archaeon]NIQ33521.1 hypothetical protein [Nitrososphaeria archaeon]
MVNMSDMLGVITSHEDGEATFYATEDSLMKQERGSWDVSIIPYKFISSLEYAWKRSMAFCLLGVITLAFGVLSILLQMSFLIYAPIIVLGAFSIKLGLFPKKRYVVKARIGGIEVETWSINDIKTKSLSNLIDVVREKIEVQ